MNGGGCDRCLAWTMHGARTPFQESNNGIVHAAAPIDPSPRPFAQPMFPQRVLCVFRVVRALRVQVCYLVEVVLHVLRVLRVLHVPPMLPLLLPLELPLVCCVFYIVPFLKNLIL